MKIRLLAVILMFALASWLPLAAQQAAPAGPTKTDSKSSCACCSHDPVSQAKGSEEKHDHHAMACCKGQTTDGISSMECCKIHDVKRCAAKDGKSCCDSKDGKSCCGKDATACNTKDGKDCCSAMGGNCCKHAA